MFEYYDGLSYSLPATKVLLSAVQLSDPLMTIVVICYSPPAPRTITGSDSTNLMHWGHSFGLTGHLSPTPPGQGQNLMTGTVSLLRIAPLHTSLGYGMTPLVIPTGRFSARFLSPVNDQQCFGPSPIDQCIRCGKVR